MTTHTPGPWDNGLHHAVWNGGRLYAHIRSHGNLVPIAAVSVGVEGYGHEEGRANARLIAAAPDMLAALKEAETILEMEVHARGENDADYFPPAGPALKQVRAAIARAEGREG